MDDELPTRPLFDALAGMGCRRLLPRIVGGSLEFAPIDAWSELRPGRYGIPAPPPDHPAAALSDRDVVVVPGVAFDLRGRRLGRGGGHYDRAFADETTPGPLRVGVALHLQLVPELPCDSHDRPVDAIVTERGVHWVETEAAGGT